MGRPLSMHAGAVVRRACAVVIVATGIIVEPQPVLAQHSLFYGNEAAMTGASGMAIYKGGDAAYYNVAGLAQVDKTRIDFSASAFVFRIRDFTGIMDVTLPGDHFVPGNRPTDFLAAPSSIVIVRQIRPGLVFAGGVYETDDDTTRGVINLSQPDVQADGGTPKLFTQRIVFKHGYLTYHIGPMLSWAATRHLRIGGAIMFLYRTEQRHTSLITESHDEQEGSDQSREAYISHYESKSTIFGARLVFGLQWEFVTHWHLGLLVRTPTLSFGQSGDESLLVTATKQSPPATSESLFQMAEQPLQKARMGMVEPAQFVLGLAYKNERFWIGTEGEFSIPLKQPAILLDDRFQFNVRLGALVRIDKIFSLGIGIFTDRSPRYPPKFIGEFHLNSYGFATGLRWKTTYDVTVHHHRHRLVFATTMGLRYAAGLATIHGNRFEYTTQSFQQSSHEYERTNLFHDVAVHIGSGICF